MTKHSARAKLYTDGGARGNPGPAAIGGLVLRADGSVLASYSERIGTTTNNVAEYTSLLHGLRLALDHKIQHLDCYLDSELVVKQLSFSYKVKDKALAKLFMDIHELRGRFKSIYFRHIPREKNSRADDLVNQALDQRS